MGGFFVKSPDVLMRVFTAIVKIELKKCSFIKISDIGTIATNLGHHYL